MTNVDVSKLMHAAREVRPDLFVMPSAERTVIVAYSLSKMTIADEMAEFHRYTQMPLAEFYEFIGRWAELVFKMEAPLIEKIE